MYLILLVKHVFKLTTNGVAYERLSTNLFASIPKPTSLSSLRYQFWTQPSAGDHIITFF